MLTSKLKCFLSYRRKDWIVLGAIGRIFDKFEAHFGKGHVFMDFDSIPPGVDFRSFIDESVGNADVLLVLMGNLWTNLMREKIQDPVDFVRLEIESALSRGIPVIPILVGETKMPDPADLPESLAELSFLNAVKVDPGRHFHSHVDSLIADLEIFYKTNDVHEYCHVHDDWEESDSWEIREDERTPAGLKFVLIPEGTFLKGSPLDEDGRFDNEFLREITLTTEFEIAETPVTQAQWKEIMGNNPSKFSKVLGRGNLPVERVNWEDAVAFCDELSNMDEKYDYTLPTDAQWEYACRAGKEGAFNIDNEPIEKFCWYEVNSGQRTHPVKQKLPNDWGLFDMHGQVWEWCADWYQSDAPSFIPPNPTGPENGKYRIIRGGSWDCDFQSCRSAFRGGHHPGVRDSSVGFRPVRTRKRKR